MHENKVNQLSLDNIVNHLGDGILCCNNDALLTIAYASASFYHMLGYVDGEITALLGQAPDGVLKNDPPINTQELSARLKKEHFALLELKLRKKDGHHIWAECHVGLMTEDDGTEAFCSMVSDVTQKRLSLKRDREQFQAVKQAKMELAESEERYRIIMEQAADPICDYNFKTQELYCSYPFVENFGLDVQAQGLLDRL